MGSVEFAIGEVLKSKKFATYIRIVEIHKDWHNYRVAILNEEMDNIWVSHELIEEFYAKISSLEKELL